MPCLLFLALLLALAPSVLHAQPAPLVLDPTFGQDGITFVHFEGASMATTHAFLRLPDGRLLGVGSTTDPNFLHRAALARVTPDGQPDPTFGDAGDGTVAFATTTSLECYAAALDAEGRILCAGQAVDVAQATLARFTSDGQPDATFGVGGVLLRPPGAPTVFQGLHRLPDGRILVFGLNQTGDSQQFLWRLRADGTPDPGFNGGAPRVLTTTFCFGSLDDFSVATPDGGLAVGCFSNATGTFAAARFDSTGTPDPAFGDDGLVVTSVPVDGRPTAVALDGAGRLLIAGTIPPCCSPGGRLIRLLPDGSLDPTFGAGGVAEFVLSGPFANQPLPARTIAVLPDGRLVVVGEATSGPAFLAQLTPDGQPDGTFAPGGVQDIDLTPGGGTGRELFAAAYDDAGRIVGLGTMFSPAGPVTFGFTRLVREGTVATEPGSGSVPALTISPNPARGRTTLRYDLARPGRVRLAVYDLLGREVAVLVDGEAKGGHHELHVDGRGLPAGVYLVRLSAGADVQTRRVTLLR